MADPWRPDPDQGVFETLLVLDGQPVELEAHLTRLRASLAELFPGHPIPDLPALDVPYGRLSTGTSAAGGLQALRIAVAPDGDGELEAEIGWREVSCGRFMSLCGTNPPQAVVSIESLALAGGLGAHKWADRSLLDEAQAGLPADSLPLIVDTDGAALEASRANVFSVRDGALFTPPLDGRILPGITRMRVMEIAGTMGVDLREEPLTRDDLLAADDVFLTGSISGIERVDSLDGRPLDGRGEIANRVSAELWSVWRNAKSQARVPNRMSASPGRSMTKRDGHGTVPA